MAGAGTMRVDTVYVDQVVTETFWECVDLDLYRDLGRLELIKVAAAHGGHIFGEIRIDFEEAPANLFPPGYLVVRSSSQARFSD